MRPAVFLDRDGTMLHDPGYLSRLEDVRWFPWSLDAIRLLNRVGFLVFVATNQGGIALGMFDEARYTSQTMTIERGEIFVLYSDGITEAENAAGVPFEEPGLRAVIASDLTGEPAALGRTILGKPEDARDAERMLALLSGTTHRVLTAVALQHGRRRQAAPWFRRRGRP